jgi:integrase
LGECAGLRWECVDLGRGTVRIERVAVEVSGRVTTKPYPKSRAGRRTVPVPPLVAGLLREHREEHSQGPHSEVFVNEAGTPMRRTAFRARIWRPSLVRAGLLWRVTEGGDGEVLGQWPTVVGLTEMGTYASMVQAVQAVARNAAGGLRFHDLRHSYASWLITSGVAVTDVQRVMGHEQPTNTLAIYTHVLDGVENRVLDALLLSRFGTRATKRLRYPHDTRQ